jgi:AcrR family transcriptional regulator
MVINQEIEREDYVISEIIGGARALFEKYGLKKTTMEDIAREVGKSKSSLYYYFPSKFEIFESVIEQETREFFIQAEESINKVPAAVEKLKAYSRARICCIKKLANLSQVARNNLMDNLKLIMTLKKKYELRQFAIVKRIINEGIESGEFKNMDKEGVDLMSFVFLGIFRGEANPLCSEVAYPDLAERVDRIVDLLVEGIGK